MNRRTISLHDGSFYICNCGFGISVNFDTVLRFFLFFVGFAVFGPSLRPPRLGRNEKRSQKREVSLGLLKLSNIRELNQTRRQRKREPYLKTILGGCPIISQLFKVITLANCVLTILELNWNQRFRGKRTKLSSYAHVVHTTAKQVISRRGKNEKVCEMSKNEKCTCKACKACKACKTTIFLLKKFENL